MATNRGKNKAKPKLKRRRPVGAAVPHINTRRTFERAYEAFFDDDNADNALKLLQQIEAQGYMSIEEMRLYLDVLHQLRDFDQYARVATVMAERSPEDPVANLLAASGAYATMQPVSAIQFFERVVKLAPEHPGTLTAKEELVKLLRHLPEILDAFIDDLPKDLPRIASIEKILHVFKLGRFDDVIRRAEKHLQTYPADIRIRNNLAEGLALKGDGKRAMKLLDETLGIAPDNFFARAARCRVAYLRGNTAKSRADADKLFSLQPRQLSDLTKAAQSFAIIGDDNGIRWAYEEAAKRNWLSEPPTDVALLTNFFATSLARAGNTESAKAHWKQVVKLAGKASTAQENLDDLRQPLGEQWGPAYFDLQDCLSQTQQDDIREIGARTAKIDNATEATETLSQLARCILAKHPEIEHAIPAVLDRGNEGSQRLFLILARGSQSPVVKAALLDYLCGSRGTDEIRRQLLMWLKELGHTFESPLSMYAKGKVQKIEIISFEITYEPTVPIGRTDETCELLEAANNALHDGNGVEAERLLRQARQIEPEQPDVLNNLAVALQTQKRTDEADLLVDEIIKKFPNYFFSKLAAANRSIIRKQYDEALELLVELQRRKRLHYTEFFGLAKSMIHLYVGRLEHASAQYWLDLLEKYEPDYPELPALKRFMSRAQNAGSFWKQMFA